MEKRNKGYHLDGLCTIAIFANIEPDERKEFTDYLHKQNPTKGHFRDTKNTNTERLEWLNRHIKLNS